MIFLLDIIECELASSVLPQESSRPVQSDFLLPVHIRQEEKALENGLVPLLNQWKLIEANDDDDLSLNHLENFHRIGQTVDNSRINSTKIQVNHHTSRFSLSESLLYSSSFLSHRLNVKRNYSNNISTMI